MQLAKRLFGVDIEAADGQAAIWDPAVRFFVVKQDGVPKAHFFLDPYSRPEEKRGGAWMDEVAGQSRLVCFVFPNSLSLVLGFGTPVCCRMAKTLDTIEVRIFLDLAQAAVEWRRGILCSLYIRHR